MSGGARIPSTTLGRTNDLASTKTSLGTSTFQETLGRTISSDPKASFTTLSRVLQSNEVPLGQRVEALKQIAHKIISNPNHPFSHIEAEVRSDMIESVATVMAGSHIKLPAGMG